MRGRKDDTLDRSVEPPNISVNEFTQPCASSATVGPTSDADLATLEGHLKAKYLIP